MINRESWLVCGGRRSSRKQQKTIKIREGQRQENRPAGKKRGHHNFPKNLPGSDAEFVHYLNGSRAASWSGGPSGS